MSRSTWSAAALAVASLATGAAQAQVVVRDAETGKLRAPTAAEAAELFRDKAASKATIKPGARSVVAGVKRAMPGGGVAVTLDESTMVYSVARVNAEGAVERECIAGADAATQLVQAPKAFAKPIRPTTTTARGAIYELE